VIRRLSRREFLGSLAALAASPEVVVKPQSAYAQQSASPRHIGVLLTSPPEDKDVQQFRQGLREAGYSEGRDVVIDWRSANGDYAQTPALVADLVKRKVDVIVVETTVGTKELKRATSTIPIVMATVADPVGSGLVTSLAHPGGNVTGLSLMSPEISTKRLQLLKEAIPPLTLVAVLWNPDTPFHPKVIEELKAAAPVLSLNLSLVGARTPDELSPAFSEIRRTHAQGLYVMEDGILFAHRSTLLKLASRAPLPASFADRAFVDEGGLMSYAPNFGDLCRRSAGYVDKILKGAKPSDLPIGQPDKFELVVNLKAAKALGLAIPQSILVRADEVIR